MKINIQCNVISPNRNISVVGLNWFHGKVPHNQPVLAICYQNGKMQIMRNENDDGIYLYSFAKAFLIVSHH